MGQMTILPPNAVTLKDGHTTTDSLTVAEVFGKEHKHVLRAIEELDCSEEFSRANFGLANYLDKQGKSRPMFVMGKDGFTFLVMGFTGAEAAKRKEAYIQRFNQMESALRLPVERIVEVMPTVTISAIEQARQEAEIWKMKYELEQSKREVDQLKKQIGGDERYYFTDADDEKLIRYKRQGLGATKIHKRHPEWKEDSISSRFRKLKKEGKF